MPSSGKTKVSGLMSSLTTDMVILLRLKISGESTDVSSSRSLSNLENEARRGGVRQQAVFRVGDARFGGRGAAADIERAAFGADRAGVLGHPLDEADLEFERGVTGTCRQHGVDREPHRRIQ